MVLAIFSRWSISDRDGAAILGEEREDFVEALRVGRASLRSRDAKDRVQLFLRLYEGVFTLFENSEAERRWINEPQPALQNESIFSLLAEGSFLNLARAQAFVDSINGR
jgi:hypothetical protein